MLPNYSEISSSLNPNILTKNVVDASLAKTKELGKSSYVFITPTILPVISQMEGKYTKTLLCLRDTGLVVEPVDANFCLSTPTEDIMMEYKKALKKKEKEKKITPGKIFFFKYGIIIEEGTGTILQIKFSEIYSSFHLIDNKPVLYVQSAFYDEDLKGVTGYVLPLYGEGTEGFQFLAAVCKFLNKK